MIQSDTNVYTCKYTLYKGEGHHYWHQRKMQEVGILSCLSISVHIVPLGYSMALFLRKGSMIPCEHDKSNWQVGFYWSIFIDSAKVAHETGVQTLSLTEICFLAALFLPSHPGPSGYGSRAFGQSNELLGNQKNAQRVSHASSRPWLNTYVYIVPSLTYSIRLSSNGGLFGLQSEVWSWIFQHYTWQGLWIRRAVDRGSLWFDLGHVRRRFVQVLKTPVIRLHVKIYVRILRDPGHVLLIFTLRILDGHRCIHSYVRSEGLHGNVYCESLRRVLSEDWGCRKLSNWPWLMEGTANVIYPIHLYSFNPQFGRCFEHQENS